MKQINKHSFMCMQFAGEELGDGSNDSSSGYNTDLSQAGLLGGAPFVGHMDVADYLQKGKDRDRQQYTDEDRDRIRNNEYSQQQENYDYANSDEARTGMYKHWANNHAKNNVRGNLNGKSFAATLNLSRAADALNNMRHWDPGTTGFHTSGRMGSETAQMGKSERWEPIETQEMRQMRANETADALARQNDINRSGKVEDYALDRRKAMDDARVNMATALNMSDKEIDTAARQAAINVNMNLPAQTRMSQMLTNFTERLRQRISTENGNYLIGIFNSCGPEVASIMAPLLGGSYMPSDMDVAMSRAARTYMRAGANPEDAYAMATYAGMMTGYDVNRRFASAAYGF